MGRGEKISFFFKGVVDNMLFVLGLAREFIYIIFLVWSCYFLSPKMVLQTLLYIYLEKKRECGG